MPRWLNKRRMKNQILNEKQCEALGEIFSSGKGMPWNYAYFRLDFFSGTGWPLESFSVPWFCIFPKNILTKCFHLDLVSIGMGVLPCFYNFKTGDLTSFLAIPDWNSFSKSYFQMQIPLGEWKEHFILNGNILYYKHFDSKCTFDIIILVCCNSAPNSIRINSCLYLLFVWQHRTRPLGAYA